MHRVSAIYDVAGEQLTLPCWKSNWLVSIISRMSGHRVMVRFSGSFILFFSLDSRHYFLQLNPAMQRYAPTLHSLLGIIKKQTKNLSHPATGIAGSF
jgi:hypothetical protein